MSSVVVNPVSIIVPVYGDWSSLKECVQSLADNVDMDMHKVLLVNDCGPDADVIEENLKKFIANNLGFSYFRNEKNLGFVQNCNNAVQNLDKTDNDVLLLNSDTSVTEGFLDELSSVLHDSSAKIGAVSPRSNNATICTVPLSDIKTKKITKAASYGLFKKHNKKFQKYSLTPTAHGFCMLIKRELINKNGLFDEVFGKGYGEEVDFCRRIINQGYSCAISNYSYVFHLEARSFSKETKLKLLEINNKIIKKRYPEYKEEVTSYIQDALVKESKIYGNSGKSYQLTVQDRCKAYVKRYRAVRWLARLIRK